MLLLHRMLIQYCAIVHIIFEVIYEMFHILNCGFSRLFQASIRNCLNCVHNCDDHSSLDFNI